MPLSTTEAAAKILQLLQAWVGHFGLKVRHRTILFKVARWEKDATTQALREVVRRKSGRHRRDRSLRTTTMLAEQKWLTQATVCYGPANQPRET